MSALRVGVVQAWLTGSDDVPGRLHVAQLAERLDELGLRPDLARWAVESWGLAVGRLALEDLAEDGTEKTEAVLPAKGTIRLCAPVSCQITLDNRAVGVLTAGQDLVVEAEQGAHVVTAVESDGQGQWRRVVEVENGEEVRVQLLPAVSDSEIPPPPPPTRKGWSWVAGVMVLVGLVGLGVWAVRERQQASRTFRLTVAATPSDSTIDILEDQRKYTPGMALQPGQYTLRVTRANFEPVERSITISNQDVSVPIELPPSAPPPPQTFRLTVAATPSDSTIDILEDQRKYTPGMALQPGQYTLRVTRANFEPVERSITISNQDVSVPIELPPSAPSSPPSTFRLTVKATPSDSTITILEDQRKYTPGMALQPGQYTLRVTRANFEPVERSITISNQDVSVPIKLPPSAPSSPPSTFRLTVKATPSDSTITILNSRQKYYPGIALTPGSYKIRVAHEGYGPVEATITIRHTEDVEYPIVLTKDERPVREPKRKQQEAERARLLEEQKDLDRRIADYNERAKRSTEKTIRLNQRVNGLTQAETPRHNAEVEKHTQEVEDLHKELQQLNREYESIVGRLQRL